ncbi:orotate phosphoribosyltransferase [Pelagicoccus sp. NFK12]|uniref:Orotate phosphoribosyltransferase n=1 Tax=Pelagicoccus enzymogenes TaxID=2773457 RepID=A0A927FB73_9BACT|nr:orotate phosphoribosyltransferase [Pelagicoccus enzymogenes]MBD5780243.1 orotate phosphoribosyltransferase [Pelagicoccus enzymogenes]MDQ8198494.1 orotate phosphoribosyltransferase [Pelagicoccus enzymogenes]
MQSTQDEVLDIFKRTKALLEGHFILRSGLRSQYFFQCAQVCQYIGEVTRLIELLKPKLDAVEFDTVLAPAMGGLVVGQEVARQFDKRYIFVEKVDDKLALRRGFKIAEGERILIVEDVVTRGGRVNEAVEIVKQNGGVVAGIGVLVDRSQGKVSFEAPLHSLLEMGFPTYDPENLPDHLKDIPAIKPGS